MWRSRARRARASGAAVLVAALVAAAASAAATATDGKTLYTACVACHGAHGEGVPATGAPNIGGAEAWYLERQLQNFATGLRGAQPGDTFGATMKAASVLLASDRDR